MKENKAVGRAYSLMTVKSFDDDKREITGIATTPEADRAGDIVDSEGAEYTLPIPLLWQHDSMQPIGEVYAAKKMKEGIEIKARLIKVDAPSQLSARLDEAWASIKTGLVKGLSIGFTAIEYAFMDTGGIRFSKWNWLELSAVTIPANASASIATVKSLDHAVLTAASGTKVKAVEKKGEPSGASEKHRKPVKLTPKEGKEMSNISENIKNFKAEHALKAAKLKALVEKSDGSTLDEKEAEEFDTLQTEITSIEKHLERLEAAEKLGISKATAVTEKDGTTEKGAIAVRQHATVKAAKPHEPGIGMARVVRCIGLAKGNMMEAEQIAKRIYADDEVVVNAVTKAAVSAGSTTDATWANPLVDDGGPVADFIEFLRPQTIIGKFGLDGVPNLRNIPFYTKILAQTSGGAAGWVGEGKAKPVTKFDFNDTMLLPLKVAAIAVVTDELLRNSSPSADKLIRDGLVAANKERLDIDFIDPAKAAAAGVSPASISNGVTPIHSVGNDQAAILKDLTALWAGFIANKVSADTPVYIMGRLKALAVSQIRNPLGQRAFPDLGMNGGLLEGVPVITSEYIDQLGVTAGDYVFLVNASDIFLGDEGGFRVDLSREASIEMQTAPTQSSITPTAAALVSMFQTNSVAFRAERTINWSKRRNSAVAVLDRVNWGE